MRLGKRMKEILEVLKEAKEPMTLSEIICRIYGKQYDKKSSTNKLATALIDHKQGVHLESICFEYVKSPKTNKTYHPWDYANILFALYSRSMNLLYKHGYVLSNAQWKRNKRLWQLNVKNSILNVKG